MGHLWAPVGAADVQRGHAECAGEPRDRRGPPAGRGLDGEVPHALPRRGLRVADVAQLRRRPRAHPEHCRHVRPDGAGVPAVPVRGGGPGEGESGCDALAGGPVPRALVQQQRAPLHGGAEAPGGHGGALLQIRRGPGLQRPHPQLRAEPQGLPQRGRPLRDHPRRHRRRRQLRGAGAALEGAAARLERLPRERLRRRPADGAQRHARQLGVAPRRLRRAGSRTGRPLGEILRVERLEWLGRGKPVQHRG
mmetsp:Transcript_109872/g.354729  ORF Transcript_109872/g.354729 Transcript_109872/m.354729 type:complete len:250 (+) Transcript_109872:782-1531(+)